MLSNRSSVTPADHKRRNRGDPALTKRSCGFDSRLLLGPVIPKTFKNGSGLFLHGTHNEGGTTKRNWSARCQYNVTGWVSMWAYDMLSQ